MVYIEYKPNKQFNELMLFTYDLLCKHYNCHYNLARETLALHHYFKTCAVEKMFLSRLTIHLTGLFVMNE